MDPARVRTAKAEVEVELADIEVQYQALTLKREALQKIRDGYDELLTAAGSDHRHLPTAAIVLSEPDPRASSEAEATTVRIRKLLQQVSPELLSPRQVMEALQRDGWSTGSTSPINVVRNTLGELAKRTPEIVRRGNDDGSVGYGWVSKN